MFRILESYGDSKLGSMSTEIEHRELEIYQFLPNSCHRGDLRGLGGLGAQLGLGLLQPVLGIAYLGCLHNIMLLTPRQLQ